MLLETETQARGYAAEPPRSPYLPTLGRGSTLPAEGDEEEDEDEEDGCLSSGEERGSEREKGDGASLMSPDGNGNSESLAGFVGKKKKNKKIQRC